MPQPSLCGFLYFDSLTSYLDSGIGRSGVNEPSTSLPATPPPRQHHFLHRTLHLSHFLHRTSTLRPWLRFLHRTLPLRPSLPPTPSPHLHHTSKRHASTTFTTTTMITITTPSLSKQRTTSWSNQGGSPIRKGAKELLRRFIRLHFFSSLALLLPLAFLRWCVSAPSFVGAGGKWKSLGSCMHARVKPFRVAMRNSLHFLECSLE